jgi:hypothetical protein
MKHVEGDNSNPFRGTQDLLFGMFHVKRLEPNLDTRGGRLAYARRLLGAARGDDLSRDAAAKLVETTGQTWGRWEDDVDRWRDSTLQKLVELFRSAGLEWVTPAWLDHGYGDVPVIVSPPREGTTEMERIIPMGPRGKKVSSGRKTKVANPRKRTG